MLNENTNKKINVLVLTRNAWNNNNCTGNTLSNFFGGINRDINIANAFFRAERIENDVCDNYFRITEQEIIRNLFKRGKNLGSKVESIANTQVEQQTTCDIDNSKKCYSFFSRHRWVLALWARELLWMFGGWKSKSFNEFLDEFSPNVIYMPCYDSAYMHRILWYVKKRTGARVLLFSGDDTYSLKQLSFSPLYWIDRFIIRHITKKSVKLSDTFFVISDLQKRVSEKIFKKECVVLRKGRKFDSNNEWSCNSKKTPIKMVYTGNIHSGRWKTLAELASAIREINSDGEKVSLDIYTLSSKSKNMIKDLTIKGEATLKPPATNEEIAQAIENADILVFVEPFSIKEKLKWRLSFSTKIVDYLASSKAILAIGPEGLASMEFLRSNDAAICVSDVREIKNKILHILDSNEIINEYAKKAWECGKNSTGIDITQETLYKYLRGDKINGESKQYNN